MNAFRCDACGRYISYCDLDRGLATIHLIYPDSAYTVETFETLCKEHSIVNVSRRYPAPVAAQSSLPQEHSD